MKLIATKRSASEKSDRLCFVREDGSRSDIDMPRQGVLPHDLVHFVVEVGLELKGGFLSLVAAGADARFVMDKVHSPMLQDVQRSAVQAEAIVEALQAQLWAGSFEHDAFLYGLKMAAEARGIDAPQAPTETRARALFESARNLNEAWRRVEPYQSLELDFSQSAA